MEPAAWTVIGTVAGALAGSISSILVAHINRRSQADLLEKTMHPRLVGLKNHIASI